MNDNKEFEFLTQEEAKALDEKLKKAENTELPESLSPENIVKLIENVPQDDIQIQAEQPKKPNKKKILLKTVSAAAAVIVALTSVAIIKPWHRISPKVQESVAGKEPDKTEDYSQIEDMFAEYSNKYHSYRTLSDMFSINTYNGKFDSATAVEEDGSASYSEDKGAGGTTGTIVEDTANGSADDVSHGETNEQVKGVSEADIIKNDGKYLYIVNPDNADWDEYYEALSEYDVYINGTQATTVKAAEDDAEKTESGEKAKAFPKLKYNCRISVVEPNEKGEMKEISKIEIAKPQREDIYYMSVCEMYVENDRLVAVLECQVCTEESDNGVIYGSRYFGGYEYITMAVAYDISDRKNPVEEWRVFQDGSYISSRLIGDELVLLSNYYVDITEDEEKVRENCIPENSCDGKEFSRVSVNDICIMDKIYDTSYLVASVLDTDDENTLKTEAVLGAGENVYCTTKTLYATSTDYDWENERMAEVFDLSSTPKTQIYKFDIRDYDIKYLKNAAVDGSALNQFSMDEYNGYLRIATTSGNWGDSLVNQVYILDENLETVGLLKNIAKGETIESVRFTGNTAYVVTFVQTDPLFVIDLTDVTAPKILGELKLPGYSAYLHPVGDGLVMGVGLDGTESGTNGGMKVSLFDVSDPTKPTECGKYTISGYDGDGSGIYVESEAYYNHKALCWDEEKGIMYIPYSKWEYRWSYTDEDDYSKSTAGIVALKVNKAEKSLSVAGEYIANSAESEAPEDFSRATYINDTVFGYSTYSGMICSFDKSTQKQIESLDLN
ncbi:MAG: beta-propeller domain-containing protein [Acutalibacteraceae bacterium]